MKSLSVFFPAYNEEENIAKQVDEAVNYLDTLGIDYEVLVINDMSTDRTAEIVNVNFKDKPQVKVIDNDTASIHGYGSALRKGFASFTKDMVFFTDSDLQFDIKEIGLFLNEIDKNDYVIGYRINRQDAGHRILNAKLWGLAVRILLGVNVKDIDCAFKLFNRDIIKSIDIRSNSALINAEFLFKLNQKHYTFSQIGVHHFPRVAGKPTGANLSVILKAVRDLMKIRFGLI